MSLGMTPERTATYNPVGACLYCCDIVHYVAATSYDIDYFSCEGDLTSLDAHGWAGNVCAIYSLDATFRAASGKTYFNNPSREA